jgi:hypothetical protein
MNQMLIFAVSEYKLTDLLSAAGATIGIIIAGTIFRQFLSTKYRELLGRYRSLTGEYRDGGAGESRHVLLQEEIRCYHRRLRLTSWASRLSAMALLSFLGAVLAGGLSMVWPAVVAIKVTGTMSLMLGLVLMGVGVALDLFESFYDQHEIGAEAEDLDEPAKRSV